MKTRNKFTAIILSGFFIVIGALSITTLHNTKTALAVNANDWRAGNIIDDALFYDSTSMSVNDIQAFMNSKVPSCDTNGTKPASEYGRSDLTHAQYAASRGWHSPPYVCLRDYYQVPRSDQNINNLRTNSIPAGAISAAQIIKNAADTHGVSPKVLLAILQKESPGPLLSDTWPLANQFRNAMGYGCPDTAPCDPSYEGFYNQMMNAAWQFKAYRTNPSSYRYKPFQTNSVYYSPDSSCGASNVYIENYATAGLYNYTPYQPNQAALNNMYGSGDDCSAYGNRNFWRLYNDWFGSTISHTIDSNIKTKYDQVYSTIGRPLMSTACGIRDNGCYQHFANGSIYWSSASGAQRIGGGIKNYWNKQGSEWGRLGYPTGDETYFAGGAKQDFQGGTVYWLGSDARTLQTNNPAVGEKYVQNTNNLGLSTMSTACGIRDNGCYQHFANGSIYWSSATGAQRVGGGIKNYWSKQNAEWGRLGYPTSDETYFAGGAKQDFQGGTVYWLGSDNTTYAEFK